jgi:8-oxo-dGTP diphosphatase
MGDYFTTILTNMVMLYDEKGHFLVENRLKQDWPGLNFPGGHVERQESLEESAIREMKEETGLTVSSLEEVGVFEWNVPQENLRHLAILYRSKTYTGTLKSSKEGPVFWITMKDVASYPLSTDFDKILRIMRKGLD